MGRGRRGTKRQFDNQEFQPTQEQLEFKAKRMHIAQCQEREMLQKRNKLNHDLRTRGPLFDPNKKHAFVLYPNKIKTNLRTGDVHVVVDPRLSSGLEKHQKEGVEKMYQWLSKHCNEESKRGFILADGMGLGKTVQTIAVLWTLLTQSPHWDEERKKIKPEIQKAIIVCPKSVIQVWSDQIKKWLLPSGQLDATNSTISVETLDDKKNCDKKKEIASNFMQRSNPTQVLILSYETFLSLSKPYQRNNKINDPLLDGPLYKNTDNVVGLIILDEAHYIKNSDAQRSDAITCFYVERKIALTGTPLQNQLKEYYTLINYIQENVLEDEKSFKEEYEQPILKYVENNYDMHGKNALQKLKRIVEPFFLRRTANPFVTVEKTEYIVCCKMQETSKDLDGLDIQLQLYNKFVDMYLTNGLPSPSPKKKKGEKKKQDPKVPKMSALQAISFLKDLCAHPALTYGKSREFRAKGIQGADELNEILDTPALIKTEVDDTQSAKFRVLNSILLSIMNKNKKEEKNDRVVIVSYYTSTLDAIEKFLKTKDTATIPVSLPETAKDTTDTFNDTMDTTNDTMDTATGYRYHYKRFDGSTIGSKRSKIIKDFNDPHAKDQFILTLSSRAGGCGISLTGANHLIMFDPDWNPANDEQAMSRIYREGQKKNCFIYRFMTTASIEEHIFHRQIFKKLLAGAVLNEGEEDGIFNSIPLYLPWIGGLSSDSPEEMGNKETLSGMFTKINSVDLSNSLTHSQLDCNRCDTEKRKEVYLPQNKSTEEYSDALQLNLWRHHYAGDSLSPDCEALQDAWIVKSHDESHISFVFHKNTKGAPISNKKSNKEATFSNNNFNSVATVSRNTCSKAAVISSNNSNKLATVSSKNCNKRAVVSSNNSDKLATVSSKNCNKGAVVSSNNSDKLTTVSSKNCNKGAVVSSNNSDKLATVSNKNCNKGAVVSSNNSDKLATVSSRNCYKGAVVFMNNSITGVNFFHRNSSKGATVSNIDIVKRATISSSNSSNGATVSSIDNNKALTVFRKETHISSKCSNNDASVSHTRGNRSSVPYKSGPTVSHKNNSKGGGGG